MRFDNAVIAYRVTTRIHTVELFIKKDVVEKSSWFGRTVRGFTQLISKKICYAFLTARNPLQLASRHTTMCSRAIAQALEVSLDYLTGNSEIELNKATLDRVQEVTKLSDKDKEYIFVTLDALIRDFKNKQAYAE